VVARECGFSSWPALRRQLELLAGYRRDPDAVPAVADPADDFCRLACLVYSPRTARTGGRPRRRCWPSSRPAGPLGGGGRGRGDPAALADPPGRPGRGVGADRPVRLGAAALPHLLPGAAGRPAAGAGLLLDAGADPDAGYAWHGLTPPFTALTGCFGEGEQGPRRQPRHPRSIELARLLLDAGADPNDGQTLYNRMFFPATTTSSCCSRTGSAGRAPASGGTGSAARWRRRPRCWPGR
jgi:hypothetical protein